MINFLTSGILEHKELIYFYLSVIFIIKVLYRLDRTRGLTDKIFKYLSDKLIFSKDMKDVQDCFDYLDRRILDTFSDYCIINFEHQEAVTITAALEDEMVKTISMQVLDSLSNNMIAILSMAIDPNQITNYIANKVIITTSEYIVSKSKTS